MVLLSKRPEEPVAEVVLRDALARVRHGDLEHAQPAALALRGAVLLQRYDDGALARVLQRVSEEVHDDAPDGARLRVDRPGSRRVDVEEDGDPPAVNSELSRFRLEGTQLLFGL